MEAVRESFEAVYRTHFSGVFNYVAYRTAGAHDVEDLVSAIFEKALVHWSEFDASKASVSVWLLTIARNHMMDGWRRRSRKPLSAAVPVAALPSCLPTPEEAAIVEETRMRVLRAVSLLSKRDRELIAFRFGASLPIAEISVMVGRSANSVAVALHRSVQRLRALLDKQGDPT